MLNILEKDSDIKDLIDASKTIVVVGLSPDPNKQSYEVASYLQAKGFKIVPVHPEAQEILGEKVYRSLSEIPFPIDIVDVFRRPEFIPAVVEETIKIKPKAVWMQLGISHDQAAQNAASHGIKVVQDRCLLIEHKRLCR